mmetsp:Transcript_71961/g.204189  ORF Transcript_71961/g.204189 Transcript_71961/m.204189 type:complete len:432 (-) Transcript_71961:59-1354(-)
MLSRGKAKLAEAEEHASSIGQHHDRLLAEMRGQRETLMAGGVRQEQVRSGLVATIEGLSRLRSERGDLAVELDRTRASVQAARAELEVVEHEAEEERAAVADLRERLKRLSQMRAALEMARAELPQGKAHTQAPLWGLAKGAQEDERRLQEQLQSRLLASVSEAVQLEVECTVWNAERERLCTATEALHAEHRALCERQAEALLTVCVAQAETKKLQQEVARAQERGGCTVRGLDLLKGTHADMSHAITWQNTNMQAMKATYNSELGCLPRAFEVTRQKKQQADLLHARRLSEIDCAGQRRRAAELKARAAAAAARPATSVTSAPAQTARSSSAASARAGPADTPRRTGDLPTEICTPRRPSSGSGALPADSERSPMNVALAFPPPPTTRPMVVPIMDMRPPDLRGPASRGPASARLGHAGRLVLEAADVH